MHRARVFPAIVLILVAACEDTVAPPSTPRTLTAISADGLSLPAKVGCPAPWEDSEAWVAFASGALTLYGDGTFEWHYQVGRGYLLYQRRPGDPTPYLTTYAEGSSRGVGGSYHRDADGALVLTFERVSTPDTPLTGTGRVTDDGGELTAAVDCLYAPSGTPPHMFTINLRSAQ
jgi:hypothetical protein